MEYFEAERREEERKAKLEEYQAKLAAQADEKKAKWLEDEAFSEDGFTFCYIMPDSYARKNELKNAGFKYNANLGWHRPTADDFEEGVICISANDVADFSAWGSGTYRASAKQFVKDAAKHMLPVSNSEWIGEEGEKVKDFLKRANDKEKPQFLLSMETWEKCELIKRGKFLDIFINDQDIIIRENVARQGFGLNQLIDDKE